MAKHTVTQKDLDGNPHTSREEAIAGGYNFGGSYFVGIDSKGNSLNPSQARNDRDALDKAQNQASKLPDQPDQSDLVNQTDRVISPGRANRPDLA